MKGWLGLALASVLVSAGVGAAWSWREVPVAVASPPQAPSAPPAPASLPPVPVPAGSQLPASPAPTAPVAAKAMD
ncbi:hypothetical protein J5H83_12010, partial [Pseudomonas otitidis]|nr:hypothetical protein [Pseudomonas otitidis]